MNNEQPQLTEYENPEWYNKRGELSADKIRERIIEHLRRDGINGDLNSITATLVVMYPDLTPIHAAELAVQVWKIIDPNITKHCVKRFKKEVKL